MMKNKFSLDELEAISKIDEKGWVSSILTVAEWECLKANFLPPILIERYGVGLLYRLGEQLIYVHQPEIVHDVTMWAAIKP